MCQMCDEYETTLLRLGLVEEAKQVRAERHGEAQPDKADAPRQKPSAEDDVEQHA